MNWRKMWWLFPLAPLAIVGFIALGGWVVMSLWNWLTPVLFGWHVIDFWQALGLLVLSRILFGGFGHHGGRGRHWNGEHKGWGRFTPEERENFREKMRSHWHGPADHAPENPSA